jgi:hypothetical protein
MKQTKLLKYEDFENDIFGTFSNDKERLKYMKKAYANMSLAKAFAVYYGEDISDDLKKSADVNTIVNIELGKVYVGNVESFTKSSMTFTIPGVKEELFSNENLYPYFDSINDYLLTHDNKIAFEVREKKNNKYYVSVIQGYYRIWTNKILNSITKQIPIKVHIDELVNGGYICHSQIDELNELTGKNYTHSVFIPGSHIVLNIEHDFEKWIGKDVEIIPQKFVDFNTVGYGPNKLIQKSLVGSRKLVLQNEGANNLYNIYNDYLMKQKLIESGANVNIEDVTYDGIVTGIINSSKKTGVFIEIDNQYITGLMPLNSMDIFNYKPGDFVKVKIAKFETQEGKEPFIVNKKGIVVKSNTRAVFEKA